jgi:hypothetical protein
MVTIRLADLIGNIAIASHLIVLVNKNRENDENILTPVEAPLIKRTLPSGMTIPSVINLLPGMVSTFHPAAIPVASSTMREH